MKKSIQILFVFLCLFEMTFAQEQNRQLKPERVDSVLSKFQPDSVSRFVAADTQAIKVKKDSVKAFKPDPARAVWMGAIIPGYGQIVNRAYWKLPIVYAGFAALGYTIYWNGTRYNMYKQAYKDLTDDNDKTDSYMNLLPAGATLSQYPNLEKNLETAYQNFRRYRDLSIVGTVAYYAVVLVEAYVDAQLFDFDISPDLSMHLRPSFMRNNQGSYNSAGVQVSLNLK